MTNYFGAYCNQGYRFIDKSLVHRKILAYVQHKSHTENTGVTELDLMKTVFGKTKDGGAINQKLALLCRKNILTRVHQYNFDTKRSCWFYYFTLSFRKNQPYFVLSNYDYAIASDNLFYKARTTMPNGGYVTSVKPSDHPFEPKTKNMTKKFFPVVDTLLNINDKFVVEAVIAHLRKEGVPIHETTTGYDENYPYVYFCNDGLCLTSSLDKEKVCKSATEFIDLILNPRDRKFKLSDSYDAVITRDNVKVGCQTFSHDVILEMAEYIKSM